MIPDQYSPRKLPIKIATETNILTTKRTDWSKALRKTTWLSHSVSFKNPTFLIICTASISDNHRLLRPCDRQNHWSGLLFFNFTVLQFSRSCFLARLSSDRRRVVCEASLSTAQQTQPWNQTASADFSSVQCRSQRLQWRDSWGNHTCVYGNNQSFLSFDCLISMC